MTKPFGINLSPVSLAAAKEGRLNLLIRPLKVQPPADAAEVFSWFAPEIPKEMKTGEGCFYRDSNGLHFLCKCPFPVGATVFGREAWGESYGYDGDADSVVYRYDNLVRSHYDRVFVDDDVAFYDDCWIVDNWKPASTMPFWASRRASSAPALYIG